MKVLFEECGYPRSDLERLFGDEFDSFAVLKSPKAKDYKPRYVGYYYSKDVEDTVFILPKVFLKVNDKNLAFGGRIPSHLAFGHYDPIAFIDSISDDLHKDVYELSTWIYQAIDKYTSREEEKITRSDLSTNDVLKTKGESSSTLFEIIQSLCRFHKEHKNLFTYITATRNSGNNRIDWNKTISAVQPIFCKKRPYYISFKNKVKEVNYDETLITLYYSVLNYLRRLYHFSIKPDMNYDLLSVEKVDDLISSERGIRLLREIRKNYFSDELVQLWNLLYLFFDKEISLKSGSTTSDTLLVKDFYEVFQDMIDIIIADDPETFPKELHEQRDGKQIDHLFVGPSFVDKTLIYYIGDSKYYSVGDPIDDKSIYKQYTYARNIIQYSQDVVNKRVVRSSFNNDVRIVDRDGYGRQYGTKGYDIIPNFFIRAEIPDLDKLTYSQGTLNEISDKKNVKFYSYQFEGKPFDRDSLVLSEFSINFLYVLTRYISGITELEQRDIRKNIHDGIKAAIGHRYDFYHVRLANASDYESFIKTNLYDFGGNMFMVKDSDYICFAFEKGADITGLTPKVYSCYKVAIENGSLTLIK